MRTREHADLGTLFFGVYRRQVLSLLLLHPEESFHLREIARVTNTQPGTLRRELALLTDAGVLQRERIGNQVHYKADPTCPIYEELRGLLKKTAGMADVLREALAPLADRITVALVFGSVARGRERRSSDIDLRIIGTLSFDDAVKALHPCQEQLRREINPIVYSPGEYTKKATGAFLSRVSENPKLFILGTDSDLRKLSAHRKAHAA